MIGGVPAHQSFFGYDNDTDLKVCFLMARLICHWLLGGGQQLKSWSFYDNPSQLCNIRN